MKHVDRDRIAPPSYYSTTQAIEERRRVRDSFSTENQKLLQTRPAFPSDTSGLNVSQEVLDTLVSLFDGKCAFCETKLEKPLIYRFRPPAYAEPAQDVSTSHLYYTWLVNAWQNLYPICAGCLPDQLNFFPVNGRRTPLPSRSVLESYVERSDGRWPDYPLEERQTFLDPCMDRQFWRSLFFRSNGEIVGISRRGQATIRHFQLDRVELQESRRVAIAVFIENAIAEIQRSSTDGKRRNLEHDGACELFMREVLHQALGRRGSRDYKRQIAELARQRDGLERFRLAIQAVDNREFDALYVTELPRSFAKPDALKAVAIKNFKSLERIEFNLPKQERGHETPALLILGENATGKSTILEAIALAVIRSRAREKLDFNVKRAVLDPKLLGDANQPAPERATITVSFFENEERTLVLAPNEPEPIQYLGGPPSVPVFAYGAYRQFLKGVRRFSLQKHVHSLFESNALLSNPEKWLLSLGDKEFIMVARALREVFNVEGSFEVIERDKSKVFVVTATSNGQANKSIRTPIDLVSSGFRAVLAMLCDIMQGLMDERINRTFESLDTARGLVLIDEIEAHLHPRWKLSIMSGLRRALPGITFIATSHDPLCLRGMKEGEVMVLERVPGEQGQSKLPVFTQKLVDLPANEHWTIEQLLTADFFQLRTTESIQVERRTAAMEDRLARGVLPKDDPELAAYLSEFSKELPIGHTEVHRLVQEAIAQYIRERRDATDKKLRSLRDDTRQAILAALRTVG